MQNSSNKFHKDIPIVRTDKASLNSSYSYNEKYHTIDPAVQQQTQQYQ